ncbi:transposable element Tcb1 transposase [Trichonephila clavipes]|nr:transposable element Tcb1 transposase [Trichonephila clavipes]
MCSNITTQHIKDLKLVSALSIAVDEFCDINDTVQVSLFVRFMSHSGPKEELLGLLPLKGQTRGEDIANAVIECMHKHHIPLDKIVSIATDGAQTKALNHRQFKEFLFEMESVSTLISFITSVCVYHSTPFTAEWSARKTSIAWSTLDTEPHRRLCHQWCDERRMWVTEWNEVVFTDESRICLRHHEGRIRVWRHRGERILNICVMHRHTGPASSIMVWGGIVYRSPLVRIAGTLNSHRCISEVLQPVVLCYLQGLATAIFQQDDARPDVARIVQTFFVNHQIELLPWPARSPDLSPIENMWSMVTQRLTQITPPAASPDQLWQRVEVA